jgi:hypothetical protein
MSKKKKKHKKFKKCDKMQNKSYIFRFFDVRIELFTWKAMFSGIRKNIHVYMYI